MRKTCDDRHPPPRRARRHEFVRPRALWHGREGRENKARTPQEPGPDSVPDSDIAKGERRVNAKSIMGVMMLAAGLGSEVTIDTDGEQAQEALDGLLALMADKFGEGE